MARDYSSIYNIEEFIINEIAPLYFNVEDVSLNRVGLLGMITDIAGSVIEDQFEATGRFLNESILPLAQLPEFIYAYAASYGVNDIFASPAVMPMFLYVKEADIINNMKPVGSHYEFTLDADMKIYVDGEDLIYSIPYDIRIRVTQYKGEYSYIATYDTSYNNSLVHLTSPYLKLIRTKYNRDMYLAIRVNVYQYERKKSTDTIITNNKLNIPYVDKTFENKLCNFEIFYQADSTSEMVQLEKKMDTDAAVTTPFIYYKMLDENTIRFSFANDDRYFVPDYNSILTIHMYETQGSLGNFDWDLSSIKASPAGATENEDIAYNRSIFLDGTIAGASQGGVDSKSLETIRTLTREAMVTINSYTTDTDLNIHFLNYGAINNTNAIFIKHRDDLAGRIYGCFTLIGNDTDIYPTNTLDIRLGTDEVDNRFDNLLQFIIKPGRRLGYDGDSISDLRFLSDDDPEQEIEYMTIALTVISLRANSMRYYMTSVDKSAILGYTYMNEESVFNFIAGNMNIYRNAIQGSNQYHITLDLTRTDGITEISQNGVMTPYIADPSRIHVLLIFNTSDGHYIPMTFMSVNEESLVYKFQAYIETTDMIDNERILLSNLKLRKTGETEAQLVDMVDPDMTVAIFYEYEDSNIAHAYSDIAEVAGATLCNTYTPEDGEFYLAYPLTLMRSHVIFEDAPDSADGYSFLLKQVPVVGKEFMSVEENAKDVFNKVTDQHQFLMNAIPQITENFTIVIKFYNTYGRSRLFYLPDEETLLNHVNSSIKLNIAFKEGIMPEDYLDAIKIFIKEYVEGINDDFTSTGVNEIHMSVLIHDLHEQFDEQIKYIEFVSINGYATNVQTIQTIEEIDATTDPTVIPEYLTLALEDIEITVL